MALIGSALGYAGLIPFVVTAAGVWVLQDALLLQVGLLYGAVILSFLGGILWGQAMSSGANGSRLVVSVVPSLIGWGGVMAGPLAGSLLLGGSFFLVWLYEQRADLRATQPGWFRGLRHVLTLVVVSCHISYAIWAALVLESQLYIGS